jgi:hypothetical protein
MGLKVESSRVCFLVTTPLMRLDIWISCRNVIERVPCLLGNPLCGLSPMETRLKRTKDGKNGRCECYSDRPTVPGNLRFVRNNYFM